MIGRVHVVAGGGGGTVVWQGEGGGLDQKGTVLEQESFLRPFPCGLTAAAHVIIGVKRPLVHVIRLLPLRGYVG